MKWIMLIFILSSCSSGSYLKRSTPEDAMKLCFLGDVGKDQPTQGQVANALKTEKCHAIIFTGDIIYPGGLKTPTDKDAESKFFKYYRPLTVVDHHPQLHIALGNHDYHNNADVWTEIAQTNKTIHAPSRFYFEEFPLACLIVMDTEPIRFYHQYLRNLSQRKWLKSQIHGPLHKCALKIGVGHHPYHNSKTKRGGARGRLKKFLEDYVLGNFNFYISGHDHVMSYEGEDKKTTQFISGAGGVPEKGFLPGYLTMVITKHPHHLEVVSSMKEISPTGETTTQEFFKKIDLAK